MHVLHHKHIIDRNDVDILDALVLELFVVLDVARNLASACACERAWDTNLHFLSKNDAYIEVQERVR